MLPSAFDDVHSILIQLNLRVSLLIFALILYHGPTMSLSIPSEAQLAYNTVLKGDPKVEWAIL